MKNVFKGRTGITLISLIIVVIIMLILAGTSISALISDGGLFNKIKNITEKYELAVQDESKQIESLLNEVDGYLNEASSVLLLKVVDLDGTFFKLNATAIDMENEISKYEFYVEDNLVGILETSEDSAVYTVTEKERGTEYKCKARVYTVNDEYLDSREIIVKTETIATGDFVNYSVRVDNIEYNKWRILHKNMNGKIEIVCYNGPDYILGNNDNDEVKSKSDYANCIYLLNEATLPYVLGTFGHSVRHLGSNPENPKSYETISEDYIYYGVTLDNNTIQSHHSIDLESLQKFNGIKKLYAQYTWLASRWVNIVVDEGVEDYGFRVRCVGSDGILSSKYLYRINAQERKIIDGQHYALAPVVSLISGVKINTDTGDGSEDNPWGLTL